MFDDQQPAAGQVPGNLPIGEPEDIFSATDPIPAGPPSPPAPPASPDAPAAGGSPSAMAAGVLRPKDSGAVPAPPTTAAPPAPPPVAPASPPAGPPPSSISSPPTSPVPPQQPAGAVFGTTPPLASTPPPGAGQTQGMSQMKGPGLGRGIGIAIIVVVFVTILGGGSWWIYSSFIKSPSTDQSFTPPPAEQPVGERNEQGSLPNEPEFVEEEIVDPDDIAREVTEENTDNELLFGEPLDLDEDQLDDEVEATLGTDPNNWDTDGDGLSDGDEVLVWNTSPINPDTDGDSYEDGREVKAGYSPTGPGRLFQVPGAEDDFSSIIPDDKPGLKRIAVAVETVQLLGDKGYCSPEETGLFGRNTNDALRPYAVDEPTIFDTFGDLAIVDGQENAAADVVLGALQSNLSCASIDLSACSDGDLVALWQAYAPYRYTEAESPADAREKRDAIQNRILASCMTIEDR